jgi:hypothetical protein
MRGEKKAIARVSGNAPLLLPTMAKILSCYFFFLAQQERFSLSDPQGLVKENKTI